MLVGIVLWVGCRVHLEADLLPERADFFYKDPIKHTNQDLQVPSNRVRVLFLSPGRLFRHHVRLFQDPGSLGCPGASLCCRDLTRLQTIRV